MIKWIRTSRLSIETPLYKSAGGVWRHTPPSRLGRIALEGERAAVSELVQLGHSFLDTQLSEHSCVLALNPDHRIPTQLGGAEAHTSNPRRADSVEYSGGLRKRNWNFTASWGNPRSAACGDVQHCSGETAYMEVVETVSTNRRVPRGTRSKLAWTPNTKTAWRCGGTHLQAEACRLGRVLRVPAHILKARNNVLKRICTSFGEKML